LWTRQGAYPRGQGGPRGEAPDQAGEICRRWTTFDKTFQNV